MASPTAFCNQGDVARDRNRDKPSPAPITGSKVPSPKPNIATAPLSQDPASIA